MRPILVVSSLMHWQPRPEVRHALEYILHVLSMTCIIWY